MNTKHYNNIAAARAAEEQSPHPTHKVGAFLNTTSESQKSYNFWPEILENNVGPSHKLGNASTTVHAEISALIDARASTNMADIYVTDLPCPNCAKTLAEAGIANVYIDTHTYNTPLGIKMKPFFETVSMLIFERAGIGIHEVDIEKQNITTLLEPSPRENDLIFSEADRISILDVSQAGFHAQIKEVNHNKNYPFAACIAHNRKGGHYFLSARSYNSIRLTPDDATHIRITQEKYEPVLQPFNRLLAHCAYYNLEILGSYLYASQTPTAREFVNMIGYGLTSIIIDQPERCRDDHGIKALKQIRDKNILDVQN